VGTINVNVKDVDLLKCESGTTKKEPFQKVYWIHFTAIVTLSSEEGTMHVEVTWNGKRCGSGGFKFVQEKLV
jgi:hypothetical protein